MCSSKHVSSCEVGSFITVSSSCVKPATAARDKLTNYNIYDICHHQTQCARAVVTMDTHLNRA